MELKLSDIYQELNKRIDSEFYKKIFVKNEQEINKFKTIKLGELSKNIKKGIFDLPPSNYLNSGVPLIRTSEIKEPRINFNTTVFISKGINELNIKTCLSENDLVFTKIGAYIGDVALLPPLYKKYNISQNVAGVSLKNKKDGYYLLPYFLSKMGKKQIERTIMLSGQGKLELADIKNYDIPVFSNDFKLKMKELVVSSHQKLEESKTLYKQSEELLLKELDLLDFQPSNENITIRTFKQSFGSSGRLDSEYYQPKYDEIIEKIKNYKGGFNKLDNILVSINTGEYSEKYYKKEKELSFYIRSTNINNGLVQKDKSHYVNKNNFTRFVKKGDIVTARVGTLGVFGTVDKNLDNSIYSDNVLCFRLTNTYNSYVYTLFLNCKCNKLLIDRLARGSVQQRLNQETLKDLLIPIIDNKTQTQIEQKIKQSFKLKEQSKQLLALAKKAVEIAIEQDENQAMRLINEQI